MADKLRFHGTIDDFKVIVTGFNVDGEWMEDGDAWSFRTRSKAILKWWPSTGTVLVQGNPAVADALRVRVAEAIATLDESVSSYDENQQVFIVHGHDQEAVQQIKMLLYELNLKPYILQETSGGGKTIIEALEHQLDGRKPRAAFGIVLLTPDDIGASAADGPSALKPRARQNVILEMGMLIASLKRSKVLILMRGDQIERPSDADGIIYKRFHKNVKEIAPDVCDRLRDAGFDLKSEDITRACR